MNQEVVSDFVGRNLEAAEICENRCKQHISLKGEGMQNYHLYIRCLGMDNHIQIDAMQSWQLALTTTIQCNHNDTDISVEQTISPSWNAVSMSMSRTDQLLPRRSASISASPADPHADHSTQDHPGIPPESTSQFHLCTYRNRIRITVSHSLCFHIFVEDGTPLLCLRNYYSLKSNLLLL